MAEVLTFHFEGALADEHRMNFYESARFQYAAARLMVKLAQFRKHGRFVQKISSKSNYDIQLKSQTDGSFNINIEDPGQQGAVDDFIHISLADLLAYTSERVVEKIDQEVLDQTVVPRSTGGQKATSTDGSTSPINAIVQDILSGGEMPTGMSADVNELVRRRVAEVHRQTRLNESQSAVSKIDFARSQKLIAMSAPLISEMATALRKSADTLEVVSSDHGKTKPVFFLDQGMAQEIETAVVDSEITTVLGDIIQFNKDNGWGKLRVESTGVTLNFSVPYDILPRIKQKLIDSMKTEKVHLQTYFVYDRGNTLIRLIAVGIVPLPV